MIRKLYICIRNAIISVLLFFWNLVKKIPVLGDVLNFLVEFITKFIHGLTIDDFGQINLLSKVGLSHDKLVLFIKMRNALFRWRMVCFILLVILCGTHFRSYTKVQNTKNTKGQKYIGKIFISGEIVNVNHIIDQINVAKDDKHIVGIMLVVNSPGGTLTGSELLAYELNKFSQVKPIVTVVKEVAASGGYMIAMMGERIYTTPGAILGSIGIISPRFEYTELAKKIGLEYYTYKTSPVKGGFSSVEKPSIEMNKSTIRTLKEAQTLFVKMLLSKRRIKKSDIKEIISGDIFFGENAIELGLADAIGTEEEAQYWLLNEKLKIQEKLNVVDITPIRRRGMEVVLGFFKSSLKFLQMKQTNNILALWESN